MPCIAKRERAPTSRLVGALVGIQKQDSRPFLGTSLGFSTRRSGERCPTSVFSGSSSLVPLPYIQDLNVLLCYPFSKFLCWTPSRCSPSCAPTLRRPPPAFDPHPASSLPPRRTNPLENRRVMKMHRLHVLAAALPGTGAGFRDCRAPETPPPFHGLRVAAMSRGGSPRRHRPQLGAKRSVSLDIVALRFNSANRHPDPVAHSAAGEVLRDLNESALQRD